MNVVLRIIKTIADIVSGLAAANIGLGPMLGFDLLAQAWLEGMLNPLRMLIGICGLITLIFGIMHLFHSKNCCER